MFDISIKILPLSDAEIYFILASDAGQCDGSLQSVDSVCDPWRMSAYSAEFDQGRAGPLLCVWGCIYEYDWLLKDNAHIWGEGVIIKTGFAPSGPPPLAHDTRIG